MLDGGWRTWEDEERPISTETVKPERRQFVARPRPKLRRALAVSATVALFSLERIGIHTDGIYDGSFNEWSAAHAPIEYGPAQNATAA